MKQLNAWVDDEIAAAVEKAAADEDRSVSAYLRRLILAHLDASQTPTQPFDEVAA